MSLSQAQAPRWFIRADRISASRTICKQIVDVNPTNEIATRLSFKQMFVAKKRFSRSFLRIGSRLALAYLVRSLSVYGHDESNSASIFLEGWVVQSLFSRKRPTLVPIHIFDLKQVSDKTFQLVHFRLRCSISVATTEHHPIFKFTQSTFLTRKSYSNRIDQWLYFYRFDATLFAHVLQIPIPKCNRHRHKYRH